MQQTALTDADFSCFPDGSYLKEEHEKYHDRYATATPFEDTEAAPFPLAASGQQDELHALTPASTLADSTTTNMDADTQYVLWVGHSWFWNIMEVT